MLTFAEFLVESEGERIDPTQFSLKTLYRQLNQQLFQSKLSDYYPIVWGKTPKGSTGITTGSATRQRGMPIWMGKIIPHTIKITISPFTYLLDTLKGIVAHEMCHVENMQDNHLERDMHGPAFMASLMRAQKHAPFKIPIRHSMDETEKAALPLKPVRFLVGAGPSGKTFVALYSPSLDVNSHQALVFAAAHKPTSFAWMAYGNGVSRLANQLTVRRKFNGITGQYVDVSEIQPKQIYVSAGAAPAQFQ